MDGVEKPEDLAVLKQQRAKVQAAYKRLMAMEENPNIIKNNSLKARGDSIKNEKKGGAPSCAARSHATARFWVTGHPPFPLPCRGHTQATLASQTVVF